ncbi:hypothetical protein [Nocardia sp. CA-290969]|uniref:hypothetical protein n=1 Tax=Nocardia sp. CA-290969 TaxID=3239986 RepID=UPI003D8F2345
MGQPSNLGLDAREVDTDVRRREFGQFAAAAGAAAITGWKFGEHIGMADVRRLLDGVNRLEAQDQVSGSGALVGLAVKQLARAKRTLDTGSYDGSTGAAFASATGHLAVQAGWLAYDSWMHPLARRCFTDALALATEAGDEDLIACVCLYSANQSIAVSRSGEGSPHHALKLIDRARTLVRGQPPGRIHALIAAREAQARSLLGDREGFGRAIATAWREVEYAQELEPVDRCPQWLRFVTFSEIRGHEARGWRDVGDSVRALECFDTAIREEAGSRNTAHTQAWAAATHAQFGDIRTAIELGTPVLDQLEAIASPRTLRVLKRIRSVTDSTAGEEFRYRFDALAASMQQKASTT